MEKQFPRTQVAGLSLSRMIIGTNWLMGWSHTSPAADQLIKDRHRTKEDMFPVLKAFLDHGVDTLMGCVSQYPLMADAVKYAEDKTGKKIHVIDTPFLNMKNTAEARKETNDVIKKARELGCEICLLHHSSVEQLVNKCEEKIERLDDYTSMIRDQGMIPGLSAHMPELIVYSDRNGYDVETYIQIYNPMGFMMQVEIETVANIIHNAKKPVMTIKPMAAGRCTPFVGFNFVWNTIRDCDMVTVGCMTAQEAYEDIEFSMAAIEHRFPDIGRRASPNQDQAAFGDEK
jgi:hypothetical protein